MTGARTATNVVEDDLDAVLARLRIVRRTPFTDPDALSGCRFERAVADDGRRAFVLKHMAYDEDWIMRASGDVACRAAAMWSSPEHALLPPTIDDAIMAVAAEAGTWTLVMRDVSPSLAPKTGIVERAAHERLFADLARMYASFGPGRAPSFALALDERLRFLLPDRLDDVAAAPASMTRMWWETFADVAPSDVAAAVLALLDDPTPVVNALLSCPATLLHGDAKYPNFGVNATHTVLLDWQLCCTAPPAVDLGWFVANSATRCAVSRDEIIETFRRCVWAACDAYRDGWERALDLALLATYVNVGGAKAWHATHSDDPHVRAQESRDFSWWTQRVRAALERTAVV